MSEESVTSEQLSVSSEEGESQNTAKQSLTVPPDTPPKTQGVKPPPDHGAGVLQTAAKKAARSNSRTDIHEYMRLRRNFV